MKEPSQLWFIYVLRCADDSLYTGITNNLDRRVAQHNAGKAARYTRGRLPVTLVHTEQAETRGEALKRELAIKSLPRESKKLLVAQPGD